MKAIERPIIFSGPMVRSILDGRKTQTRRVIRPQPRDREWVPELCAAGWLAWPRDDRHGSTYWTIGGRRGCPYGQPGDRLWVRETFAFYGDEDRYVIHYKADKPGRMGPWRPSIHMPKKYARIWLEVTGVRVERLQDISEADAKAEGVEAYKCGHPDCEYGGDQGMHYGPRAAFMDLWNSLNAKRGHGWDANPWVWVIEFRRVCPDDD